MAGFGSVLARFREGYAIRREIWPRGFYYRVDRSSGDGRGMIVQGTRGTEFGKEGLGLGDLAGEDWTVIEGEPNVRPE